MNKKDNFKSFDNFNITESKLENGDTVMVGGTGHGQFESKLAPSAEITVSPRNLVGALVTSVEFERQMKMIKTDVEMTNKQMEQLKSQVINMAVDAAVLNRFRELRVENGNTDHKKLLKQEKTRRGFEQLARVWRMSGVTLGWLFGLDPRWDFKYVRNDWRPFDWAIDCKWQNKRVDSDTDWDAPISLCRNQGRTQRSNDDRDN